MMCTAAVCPYMPQTRSGCFDKKSPITAPQEPPFTSNHQSQGKWRERLTYSDERLLSPNGGLTRLSSTFIKLGPSPQQLKTFDTLSLLPPEISLQILSYLEPQDLCRVCLVCRRWYQLAQDKNLKKKRVIYINELREHFQLAKENFSYGSETPPQNNYTRRHSTPVLGPVNTSREEQSVPRNENLLSPSLPSVPAQGLSIANMMEEKLTIDSDIRRCLFPLSDSPRSKRLDPLPPPMNRSPKVSNRPQSTEIIGKRNKGRLRRL